MHDRNDSRYDNTVQRLTAHRGDSLTFSTRLEAEHCREFLKRYRVLRDYATVRKNGAGGWRLDYLVGDEVFYVADPQK
jgi:hypothetical protein